jgi:hypothetical protein
MKRRAPVQGRGILKQRKEKSPSERQQAAKAYKLRQESAHAKTRDLACRAPESGPRASVCETTQGRDRLDEEGWPL